MADSASPPPVICTLTTKERSTRTLEWSDVSPLALSSEWLPNGTRSTFTLDDAAAIEALASLEMSCCGSWLTIETERSDVLMMTITTENPEGLDIIRSIAEIDR